MWKAGLVFLICGLIFDLVLFHFFPSYARNYLVIILVILLRNVKAIIILDYHQKSKKCPIGKLPFGE